MVLTADGSVDTGFKGLITHQDLGLQLAKNPVSLIRATNQANSIPELELYWQQSQHLINDIFSSPSQYAVATKIGGYLFDSLVHA